MVNSRPLIRRHVASLTSPMNRNESKQKEGLVGCFWNSHCEELRRTKTKRVHTEGVEVV